MAIFPKSTDLSEIREAIENADEAEIVIFQPHEEPKVLQPIVDEEDFSFPSEEEIATTTKDEFISVTFGNKTTKSILPRVDFNNPIPKNVVPTARQARVLGWSESEIKLANRYTGILTQLPMICAGTDGCEFGKICPVVNRDDFIGTPCPIQTMEAFKHFAGYVRELNIKIEDYTDLQSITELVRYQLMLWKIDMSLKTEPFVVKEVAVVSRSETAYYKDTVNKNIEVQLLISTRIRDIYEKMLMSRQSKIRSKQVSGTTDTMSVLMAKLSNKTNSK